MRRIFVDTNVVLDFVNVRDGAENAELIIKMGRKHLFAICTSVLSLQYQCALACGCDTIITRNTKHFVFSELPVFTPEEFIDEVTVN